MKKIVLFLSLMILLFSCNKDANTDNSNQLTGEWFMQSYLGFGPSNSNLSEEYILWSINTQSNTISIVNYYAEQLFEFPTGEYNFTYTENEIFIVVGNNTFNYDYEFDGNQLVIDNQPELDGSVMTFVPKEDNCINNPLESLSWLADIKAVMEQSMDANGSQIIQYRYNDECVYSIDNCASNCSDNLIEVYNIAGEVICSFGGIAGMNTCPDFYTTAVDKRYLFNNLSQFCDEPVLVNENLYSNVDIEPTISNLEIDGDCLNITYSETGCDGNSWIIKLIDSEEILESNPLQRNLKLSIVNNELCQAEITQEKSFYIHELQVDGNEVILNIQGNQILYEY